MWVNKNEYERLISENESLRTEVSELKSNSMQSKAAKVKKVLDTLGVKAESAKQITESIAMEILADDFEMQDKYSKATFIRTQGADVISEVRKALQQEGVLTKKIERK